MTRLTCTLRRLGETTAPPATLSADEVATENGQMGIVVADQSHVGPQ